MKDINHLLENTEFNFSENFTEKVMNKLFDEDRIAFIYSLKTISSIAIVLIIFIVLTDITNIFGTIEHKSELNTNEYISYITDYEIQ